MPAARNGALWSIVLLVALFLAGAWEVMVAPLTTGDVYPPFSTLRADPMGAKALFESLADQPSLNVARLYKGRSPLDRETALFTLGVDPIGWSAAPKPVFDEYEALLKNGGRVVIAFLSTRAPQTAPNTDAIQKQWDIRPRYRKLSPQAQPDSSAIPRETALYFDPGPEWKVLWNPNGNPAVVQRDLAGGTLILIADAFPLSNQGLAESSNGALIAKLVGPAKNIFFDENQFGVSETGSVAVLIRKYHLEAALAMLFAIAGLFVWRNVATFLPPRDPQPTARVTGRDSQQGLSALLRRNISEDQLLAVCWKEWSRSGPARQRAKLNLAEIERETRPKDPVAGYRAACRILTEKK